MDILESFREDIIALSFELAAAIFAGVLYVVLHTESDSIVYAMLPVVLGVIGVRTSICLRRKIRGYRLMQKFFKEKEEKENQDRENNSKF